MEEKTKKLKPPPIPIDQQMEMLLIPKNFDFSMDLSNKDIINRINLQKNIKSPKNEGEEVFNGNKYYISPKKQVVNL